MIILLMQIQLLKMLICSIINCVLYHLLSVSKKDYFMYTLLIVST